MPALPSRILVLLPTTDYTPHIATTTSSHPTTPITFALTPSFAPSPSTFTAASTLFTHLYSLLPPTHPSTFILLSTQTSLTTHTHASLTARKWLKTYNFTTSPTPGDSAPTPSAPRVVAVGGTFDHLHHGHRLLLTCTAYSLPIGRLIIGISGDALLTKKSFAAQMEPWRMRVSSVLSFLRELALEDAAVEEVEDVIPAGDEQADRRRVVAEIRGVRVECVELHEPCGPTIEDKEIEVLVVTEETMSGGEYVNRVRAEREMGELAVEVVGLVAGEGVGGKVSSTDARRREAEAVVTEP